MNQVKEHLDKIVAVALMVVCVGWIAKTHLAVKDPVVSNKQIDRVLNDIKKALDNEVESPQVPDYTEAVKRHMSASEAPIAGDLIAWKFFPRPEGGPAPPERWELEAVFATVTAAGRGAITLKKHGVRRMRIVGRRLRLEGFVSKLDPAIDALIKKCVAAGAKRTEIVEKGAVSGVDYAALGGASLTVSSIMVGKAILSGSLGSAGDKHCEKSIVQVWRRKAGVTTWPATPMVTMIRAGGKVSVSPAGVATVAGDSYEIVQSKLPARESFEYRLRKVGCFLKEVQRAGEAIEVLPPKAETGTLRAEALDAVLGGQKAAYAAPFSRIVKVETPGEVQIQYAGSMGFRLRRKVAGLGAPVSTYKVFRLGQRIAWRKDVRVTVNGKSVLKRYLIDAEANLVAVTKEMRRVPRKEYYFVKDPETGATVQKVRMVPGPKVEVQIAIIEDVRGGKKHKIEKAMNRASGWWPKNVVMETKSPGTPAAVNGGGRTGDRRGPRRGPVSVPRKVPPPNATPKRDPVRPPKPEKPKVTVSKPPVTTATPKAGTGASEPPPPPPPGTTGPTDPGLPPSITDVGDAKQQAAYEAWKAAKKAYEDYLKQKAEAGRN